MVNPLSPNRDFAPAIPPSRAGWSASGSPTGVGPSPRSRTVLIVEDDEVLREELAQALRDQGIDVATASDGVEALQMARSERPAVAIVDIMMPRMNGWEFADAVRNDPALAGL